MSTLATLNVVLNGDVGGFLKAMKDSESQASSSSNLISRALGGIGDVVKVAAGVAVAGITAAIGAAATGVVAFQSWGKQLDDLSDVLGTTADESAGLAVAIKIVGGDVGGITAQMAKLVKGLGETEGKLGPTGKLMKSLGIAFEDANGKMLPSTTILTSIADKLAVMPDGLEKTKIMTQLFGKSGKDLSDTLNALANGGLAAAEEKARALGLAIGEEGVGKSIEFGKSIETIKLAAEGVAVSIGSMVMPVLLPLIEKFSEWGVSVMPQVRAGIEAVFGWIQANVGPIIQALIGWLQQAVAWVTANWPKIRDTVVGAFEQVRAAIEPIINAISAVVTAVFGAIGTFLNTHGTEIRTFLEGAWNGIQEILTGIWNVISTVVTGVFNAIRDFLATHGATIQASLQLAWDTIRTIVDTVIHAMQGIIDTVMAIIHGDWSKAWESIKDVVETIWNGIKTLWTNFWTGIDNILKSFGVNVGEAWRNLWNGVREFFEGIWNGIRKFFVDAINSVIDLINGLIDSFNDSIGKFLGPIQRLQRISLAGMLSLTPEIKGGMNLNALLGGELTGRATNATTDQRSYTLNVYAAGLPEDIAHDFAMLQALGG